MESLWLVWKEPYGRTPVQLGMHKGTEPFLDKWQNVAKISGGPPGARPTPNSMQTIDLHGLTVEAARRRLEQELHACRLRGTTRLRVVVGRGWGSPGQRSVLGPALETWLGGPEARSRGVQRVSRAAKGGAFELELTPRS